MEEHIIHCLLIFLADPLKVSIAIASFSVAIAAVFAIRKYDLSFKAKISLIYTHLAALFLPFVLFVFTMACSNPAMPCNAVTVGMNIAIVTLFGSLLAGFVAIPAMYFISTRGVRINNGFIADFVRKQSKSMGIKTPQIRVVDKAKPMAFSFKSIKSAIFLSVGMLDILNKKETEAVLLHELAHIKRRSSVLKFSSSILNIFSPLNVLARFSASTNKEELEADRFAAEVQGTGRYLASAKKKIEGFA